MANEFKIKNALQILNTHPITGIYDSSLFTNDSSSLATINAIKNFSDAALNKKLNLTGGTITGNFTADSSFFLPKISQSYQTKSLYYNPATGQVTYFDVSVGGGGSGDSLWVYQDPCIVTLADPSNNLMLTSIEIEQDSGNVVLVDMPIINASINTEQSYEFDIDGNSVFKAYSVADGSGGVSETGLVVEATYQYMGAPNVNGSWRFYVGVGDLIFEKRIGGTWVELGRFTEP